MRGIRETEASSAVGTQEVLPLLTTRMDLEGLVLSEISQTDPHDDASVWNLKKAELPDTESRTGVGWGAREHKLVRM